MVKTNSFTDKEGDSEIELISECEDIFKFKTEKEEECVTDLSTYIKDGLMYLRLKFGDNYGYICMGPRDDTMKEYKIASEIAFIPVVAISSDAFKQCYNMMNLYIPDSVQYIGMCAFVNCVNLVSITLPKCLITLGSSCFRGCDNLMSVKFTGNSLKEIRNNTFRRCPSVKIFDVPEGVTDILEGAFDGTYAEYINLPSTLEIMRESLYLAEETVLTFKSDKCDLHMSIRNCKHIKVSDKLPENIIDNFRSWFVRVEVCEL